MISIGRNFEPGFAPVTGDHVPFAIVGSDDHDIGGGESRIEQSFRHCLRGHRRASDRIGGVDFNQLLEDVVGPCPCAAASGADAAGHAFLHAEERDDDSDRSQTGTIFQE